MVGIEILADSRANEGARTMGALLRYSFSFSTVASDYNDGSRVGFWARDYGGGFPEYSGDSALTRR
jgi:hypothetical protein